MCVIFRRITCRGHVGTLASIYGVGGCTRYIRSDRVEYLVLLCPSTPPRFHLYSSFSRPTSSSPPSSPSSPPFLLLSSRVCFHPSLSALFPPRSRFVSLFFSLLSSPIVSYRFPSFRTMLLDPSISPADHSTVLLCSHQNWTKQFPRRILHRQTSDFYRKTEHRDYPARQKPNKKKKREHRRLRMVRIIRQLERSVATCRNSVARDGQC